MPLDKGIAWALSFLVIGSIFSGYVFKDILIGTGTTFLSNTIYIASSHKQGDYEYISTLLKNIPLYGSICGFALSFLINKLIFKFFLISKYNTKLIVDYQ